MTIDTPVPAFSVCFLLLWMVILLNRVIDLVAFPTFRYASFSFVLQTELPTQKIVNLLENYGSDPVDVYSSSAVSVKARQSRSVHKSLRAMPSSYTMDRYLVVNFYTPTFT